MCREGKEQCLFHPGTKLVRLLQSCSSPSKRQLLLANMMLPSFRLTWLTQGEEGPFPTSSDSPLRSVLGHDEDPTLPVLGGQDVGQGTHLSWDQPHHTFVPWPCTSPSISVPQLLLLHWSSADCFVPICGDRGCLKSILWPHAAHGAVSAHLALRQSLSWLHILFPPRPEG